MFNRLNVLLTEEQLKGYRGNVLRKLGSIKGRLNERSIIHRPLNKFDRIAYLKDLDIIHNEISIQVIHLTGILSLLEGDDYSLFEGLETEHLHKSNVCKCIKDLRTLLNEFLPVAKDIRELLEDQEIYKPQPRKDRENKVSLNYSRYKQDPTVELQEMMRLVRSSEKFSAVVNQDVVKGFVGYSLATNETSTASLELAIQNLDFTKYVHELWITTFGSTKNPFDCYNLSIKNHYSSGQSGFRVTKTRHVEDICGNILKLHSDAALDASNISKSSGGDRRLVKEYCRAVLKLTASCHWGHTDRFAPVIKQFERAYYVVRGIDGGDDRWGNRSDPATVLRNLHEAGKLVFSKDGTVSFVRHYAQPL